MLIKKSLFWINSQVKKAVTSVTNHLPNVVIGAMGLNWKVWPKHAFSNHDAYALIWYVTKTEEQLVFFFR